MTATDYQLYFNQTSYSINTSNMVLTSWLRLGDANTIGVAGTSTYCGSVCKLNTFTIKNTSTASRNIYINAATHKSREYGWKAF